MSMSVRRLDVLAKVADSRADRAAEELARSRAGLAEQEERLQELRRYLEEYRTRPMPPTPMLIANRERFLARLDEAERQQVRAVTSATQAVAVSTQSWMEQRLGQKKVGVLQDAALGRELRINEARAQKQLDEFGLRRFGLQPDSIHE